MLTAEPSFDSTAVRSGVEPEREAQWSVARGRRHGRRNRAAARSGESGWWCPEMRSVLWATLGAVAATALLLFGLPV